jgi:hypothetical protein
MGIEHSAVPHHWNYFFCIEEDVARLSRWIEFSEQNEAVYSIELARLLMTASAECDVIAKSLCRLLDPSSRAQRVGEYQRLLTEAYDDLPAARITIPRFGKTLQPWSNWSKQDTPPLWWTANNKIKHHRAEQFHEANLKNVLNAVAGLQVLLVLHSAQENLPSLYPGPTVFEPHGYAFRDGDGIVFRKPRAKRAAPRRR